MKKAKFKLALSVLSLALTMGSCKKDDDLVDVPPPIANEAELVTTLQLHFTEVGNASNTFTYQFADIDGFGGNPPVADTIALEINKSYTVSIDVLNESESPIESLTAEIQMEKDEHLFCFEVMSGDLTISRTDTDNNNLEVGLSSSWVVGGTAGLGEMHVTLKHQEGIKDGSCSPGETDIEAHFELKLQ